MPVETNISPYYDDYSEDKNFHRILFRPGVAVQARELTQSQTIFQNQIKRIGDYLFTSGDKVVGPKPAINIDARTIRVKDVDPFGVAITPATYLNTFVTSLNSNVIGYVEFVYEKDNPDIGDPISFVISLKKYNSTNDGMFDQNEELFFYTDYTDALNKSTPNYRALTVEDTVRNAFCTVSQYSKSIILTNTNSSIQVGDLLVHPSLTKKLYVTEIRSTIEIVVNDPPEINIANDRIEFIKKATCPTTILTQDVATFYKDGFFVRCPLLKIVPDKNTAYPTKSVGLFAEERIITSNDDTSLLDPALGSSNYFARGADRLKIDISIVSQSLDSDGKVEIPEDFIPLIKFNKGEIEYLKELSTNSILDSKLAERTYDESGNYIVDPFQILPVSTADSDPNLIFSVSAGKGYVGGYQVKTIAPTEIRVPKNFKTETVENYNINTTQGNYLKVKDIDRRLIKPQELTMSEIFLETHSVTNPTTTNTRVGILAFKNLEYDSYDGSNLSYRMYYHYYAPESEVPVSWAAWSNKYNIPENEGRYLANILYESNYLLGNYGASRTPYYGLFREPDNAGLAYWWQQWVAFGRNIENIKEAFVFGASGTDAARVLSNSKSFLVVQNGSPFYDGFVNVEKVKSIVGVSNEYTSHGTAATYAAPFFYANIALGGTDKEGKLVVFDTKPADNLVFPINKPYITTVRNIQTSYIKVFQNLVFSGGTYTKTLSSPETFALGDGSVPASTARANFTLLIKTGATSNVKYGTFTYEPTLTGARPTVTISGDSASLTINTGDPAFAGTADLAAVIENDNIAIRTKTLTTGYSILNIDTADKIYDLGKSDIFRFRNIFKVANVSKYLGDWNPATSYTYSDIVSQEGALYVSQAVTTNVNVSFGNAWSQIISENMNNYVLDNGQRDSYYDHGYVTFIGASSDIPGNVYMSYDYFTHSGEGPVTAESYPPSLYGQIPTYRSTIDATVYELRDCLDFRARRIDGSAYHNYGPAVFPLSSITSEADVTYYLGRKDRLYVTNSLQNFGSPFNKFYYERGVEGTTPVEPADSSDLTKLSIAVLEIPPYTSSAFGVKVTYNDNRRYTMKDIGVLEDNIIRLDKAVKLQSIEVASLRSIITNEEGDVLLKSGILVEDFSDLEKSDLLSGYFSAAIDDQEKECFPAFAAYNIDLELITDADITIANDIITMKYQEDVFASQLEANSTVNPNPGGVNDGFGRANTNKKNSFLVNLLLTGGVLIASTIALKTAAAYIGASYGGSAIGNLATSFAGESLTSLATVAEFSAEGVLSVAWEATRRLGLSFLESVQSIEGVTKLFTDVTAPLVNIAEKVWAFAKGGFNSILPESLGATVSQTSTVSSGITGILNTPFTLISRAINTITGQSFSATIAGVQAGIIAMSTFIVGATFKGLVLASSALASATAGIPIVGAVTSAIASGTLSAGLSILSAGPLATVVAAGAIVYAGYKIVKNVWKTVKKWFSDVRMKENIQFVEKLSNGLNVYSFEYKKEFKQIAGYGRYTGVIAQEVEKLYPTAVTVENNGYKSVNYSLLGI